MRKFSSIITIFSMVLMFSLMQQTAYAATALPAANWYAVTHVQNTDTLHWVNAQGEQASMARPKLANEAPNPAVRRMEISPNGQHMVMFVSLNNGNLGIGFYDFVAGQFVQSHEAQPNESLIGYSQNTFSFSGNHFVIALRNSVSADWRIIVFETATGNAVDVLTRTSPILHQTFITNDNYYPVVASFGLDEGIGQNVVTLQTVNNDPNQTMFPSFKWYHNPVPAVANAPVVPAALPFSPFAGHDTLRTSGAIVVTDFTNGQNPANNMVGSTISTQANPGQLPQAIVNGGAFTLNSPQWMNNGAWIGYRVQNNIQQPHYAITSAQSDTSVPLGPNIGSIHSTPDGFVAVNALDWQMYHSTTLNIDAFAYQFGSTIFQSNGQPFNVIYTTSEGTPFSLASIPTEAKLNVEIGGNGGIQAPEETCGTAPAPRLTLNETARATFTTGADLNIRTAPAGDYLMQIPEGTVVNVVGGPSCADNYFWWNIQFPSDNITVGGWAAEGDSEDYYLEPYTIQLADPLTIEPTAQPPAQQGLDNVQPPVEPTPTQDLQIAPVEPTLGVVTPMPLAPVIVQVDCLKSPASQLQVGMTALSVNPGGGTLAMRTNLSDPYPSNQIPAGLTMDILAGPQCREGIRMWQVSTTLNGQPVVGWIAEGFGNNYYIIPN